MYLKMLSVKCRPFCLCLNVCVNKHILGIPLMNRWRASWTDEGPAMCLHVRTSSWFSFFFAGRGGRLGIWSLLWLATRSWYMSGFDHTVFNNTEKVSKPADGKKCWMFISDQLIYWDWDQIDAILMISKTWKLLYFDWNFTEMCSQRV